MPLPLGPLRRDDLAASDLQLDPVEDGRPSESEANVVHMENNVLQRLAVVRRLGVLKRHVCRAVFGEPCARLVDGSVEDKTATIHEEHALRKLERPLDALLGEHEGTPEGVQHLEERLRAGRVELRRRLVEQQQVRMHRQSRGQANALELASRELRGPPRGQRQRPYGGERPFDPSSDLGSAPRRCSRARTPPRWTRWP